jgi:hypothetical protein
MHGHAIKRSGESWNRTKIIQLYMHSNTAGSFIFPFKSSIFHKLTIEHLKPGKAN